MLSKKFTVSSIWAVDGGKAQTDKTPTPTWRSRGLPKVAGTGQAGRESTRFVAEETSFDL